MSLFYTIMFSSFGILFTFVLGYTYGKFKAMDTKTYRLGIKEEIKMKGSSQRQ